MINRWYQEAVFYSVDVSSFQDSDGDGRGDLRGLISRLDYLSRLGVSCLWLNPIHPSPWRDNGYDISELLRHPPGAGQFLVTSPSWPKASPRARHPGSVLDQSSTTPPTSIPGSPRPRAALIRAYRDWYVWSAEEPPDRHQGTVFPGEQNETWTFDEQAKAWYFHRFYDFQPDLNWANPAVRAEMAKVMNFWLQMGAAGFRIDAAPFVLEQVSPGVDPGPKDFSIMDSWRQETQWLRGDSVLLCEANVPRSDVSTFVGSRTDGPSDRAQMMFDFLLNPRVWLALARSDAEPLIEALTTAVRLPEGGQWVSFLRNHDELDLSRLTDEQRGDVFRAFAPRPEMRLYGRGIRRRLAPMLRVRSPPDRPRVRPPVLAAGHPGAALRRGDRDGRGPEP
jgi:maltose alpha-D-glucosyltransferase/alpha-amylase